MTMNPKSIFLLTVPLAALGDGLYVLLCQLTNTWGEIPPSAHATLLVLIPIGAAIVAIVTLSMWDSHREDQ